MWKCKSIDSVEFSDVPCPSVGEQLDSRKLRGNSVPAERAPVTKLHRRKGCRRGTVSVKRVQSMRGVERHAFAAPSGVVILQSMQ